MAVAVCSSEDLLRAGEHELPRGNSQGLAVQDGLGRETRRNDYLAREWGQ